MKTMGLLILVASAYGADFALLSKADVKSFESSFASIEDAFRERNLSPIASFGPSILSRYSALLLQADAYTKRARPSYQRLDSLVAYAIVRLRVDSIIQGAGDAAESDPTPLRQLDRVLAVLVPSSNLCLLDGAYCDGTTSRIRGLLEERIPKCVSALRMKSQEDRALELLSGLSYTSPALKKAAQSVESGVEKAYRAVLSSTDREEVLAFQIKYPTYHAEKVKERLSSLEADEMYHLLKSGSRDELVAFLSRSPNSPYTPEVRKKLEPILFRDAVEEYDPAAGRLYLSLFPTGSERGRRVGETLAWLFRPAADTGAPSTPWAPSQEAARADTLGPAGDGPRTPPGPSPIPSLADHDLGRLGNGQP